MARRVVFRPEARAEALDARQWYDGRTPGLGRAFGEALATILTRLAANPAAFPKVHGDARRAVLTHFPYAVYFRETTGSVVVLAVHGRQDPQRWQSRV